mgnify:CR=1 FL=1
MNFNIADTMAASYEAVDNGNKGIAIYHIPTNHLVCEDEHPQFYNNFEKALRDLRHAVALKSPEPLYYMSLGENSTEKYHIWKIASETEYIDIARFLTQDQATEILNALQYYHFFYTIGQGLFKAEW